MSIRCSQAPALQCMAEMGGALVLDILSAMAKCGLAHKTLAPKVMLPDAIDTMAMICGAPLSIGRCFSSLFFCLFSFFVRVPAQGGRECSLGSALDCSFE